MKGRGSGEWETNLKRANARAAPNFRNARWGVSIIWRMGIWGKMRGLPFALQRTVGTKTEIDKFMEQKSTWKTLLASA